MMKQYIVLALAVWITGCASTANIPEEGRPVSESASTEDGFSALPPPDLNLMKSSADLRIGPLDILTVNVFGVDDLSGDYQVDYEGRLKMPLVGSFSAVGFTSTEMAAMLEGKLEESYLQDPEVTVLLKEQQNRLVTIDGSVKKPGQYPLQGKITLLQAVAMSGGVDEYANLKRVVVFREVEGERRVAGFDLKQIRQGEATDPEIFANDIIIVDGSEVKRNYKEFLDSVPLLGLFFAL